MDDREIVQRQIGRPPRAFLRVVVRCPYGKPAVTEQAPFDESGEPFPTTYYLTCSYLVAAIARLEAAGGVERWSRLVRGDPELRESAERAHEEQRRLRPELPGGIGGQTRTGGLKCLHAHAAFALARPGYELGERILAEVEPLWPAERCCTRLASSPMPSELETTRREWEEGHRRLEAAAGDRLRYERLLEELELVLDELRRRVGQTFTLGELAAAYGDADRWVQEALAEREAAAGWPTRLTIVQDAAFHRYSRGAVDYRP